MSNSSESAPFRARPRRNGDGAASHRAGDGFAFREFVTTEVGGVPVAVTDLRSAVDWLHRWTVAGRGGVDVRLVNAYSLVAMHGDRSYLDVALSSGLSLPDGAPVMLAQRVLSGHPDARRVRGPSFFEAALARGAEDGVREFLLGTTDTTLERLVSVIQQRWPAAVRPAVWAPPFTPAVDDEFIESCRSVIAASGAQRVWIALGTPKQDLVAQRLAAVLGLPCIAVGAAFDFMAGTKREAPVVVQRLGLEWIFRLGAEPRRLWRRYLLGNLRFLHIVGRRGVGSGQRSKR